MKHTYAQKDMENCSKKLSKRKLLMPIEVVKNCMHLYERRHSKYGSFFSF
jgi:hypothetical protein